MPGCDVSPVFNPAEHGLDTIALSIEVLAVLGLVLSFGAGWDTGGLPCLSEHFENNRHHIRAPRAVPLRLLEQVVRQVKCARHVAKRA
jgi:hypothetical protein